MLNEENCPYTDRLCGTHAQCRDCDDSARIVVHNVSIWKHHFWQKDCDGKIDMFAFESGFCNGPRCVRCGATFCRHCVRDEDVELNYEWGCVVEEDRCPWCNHRMDGIEDDWTHCPWCGLRIDAKERRNFEFRYEKD